MQDFEIVYDTYFPRVYGFVLALCRDAVLAEEITQSAFIKAFKSYGKFRGQCDVGVWLCRIARNEYIDHCRRKPVQPLDSAENRPAPGKSLEMHLTEQEDAEKIQQALHELEEPYKEVFMLKVYGEMSHARIGALFGKSENWSRIVYYRAKQTIMERIRRDEE